MFVVAVTVPSCLIIVAKCTYQLQQTGYKPYLINRVAYVYGSVGGIGGNLMASCALSRQVMLGASSAVSALIGCFISGFVVFRHARRAIATDLALTTGLYLVIDNFK